jgi:hypothetical protein
MLEMFGNQLSFASYVNHQILLTEDQCFMAIYVHMIKDNVYIFNKDMYY